MASYMRSFWAGPQQDDFAELLKRRPAAMRRREADFTGPRQEDVADWLKRGPATMRREDLMRQGETKLPEGNEFPGVDPSLRNITMTDADEAALLARLRGEAPNPLANRPERGGGVGMPQGLPNLPERGDVGGLPAGPPMRLPLPERGAQQWWEAIPQAIAGAGDVLSTQAGRQTHFLQGVMGGQQAGRDQTFADKLQQAALEFENQKMGYEDKWRRYAAEEARGERGYQHGMGAAGLKLRERGLTIQEDQLRARAREREDTAAALRQLYADELKTAKTPEEAQAIKTKYATKGLDLGFPNLFKEPGSEAPGFRPLLEKRLSELEADERRPLDWFGSGRQQDVFDPDSTPWWGQGILNLLLKTGILKESEVPRRRPFTQRDLEKQGGWKPY